MEQGHIILCEIIYKCFSFFHLRDSCMSPRDELLTLNVQSLKDLSGKKAESLIPPTTQLVNIMMAHKVSMSNCGVIGH